MAINNIEYSKLLKNLIFFILLLVFLDALLGSFSKRIFFSQDSGKFARIANSVFKDSSEVLIMGSSYATSHYVPNIFEKNNENKFYNAGVKGQKLIFQNLLLKMILKRHVPKAIILDIDYDWLLKSPESYERLSVLYPYYWKFNEILEPSFTLNSKFLNLKLLSSLYQTNSTILHSIYYFFNPQIDYDGYLPLNNTLNTKNKNIIKKKVDYNLEIDTNFVRAFREFILLTKQKNIDLYLVVSPSFNNQLGENLLKSKKMIQSIIINENIDLIDFSQTNLFSEDMFYDDSHLNHNGALMFSKMVCDSLFTQ